MSSSDATACFSISAESSSNLLHGEHHDKTPDTDFIKAKYQNTARPVTLIDLNCFYHFP